MNAKFLLAIALAAGLLAAACSPGGNDSSPATTAAGAVTAVITQPETATTNTEAAEAAAEAQSLPPEPGADETSEPEITVAPTASTSSTSTTSATTTTSTASSAPAEEPETSESPSTTSSTTTTSAAPATTTTTTTSSTTTATVVESPVVLQVQVLNGSGVAGAAGRMTDKLSEAGYVVLSPANAPQRYSSSAVYYLEGWKDRAEEILAAADIEEIDAPTAMPQQFASEDAVVVVLLGTDTAPAVAREQASLRPRQRNDVRLPLPDSTPRDRYVPGLTNVNIYTAENDNDPQVFLYIDTLARALGSLGTFADERWSPVSPRAIEARTTEKYQTAIEAIEQNLEWLGFTPQNTCGAPAGYSFTDLLQPTREWDDNLKTYGGDAIFTTDRLLELHGGERINPEASLDFYINQAVQTAHDALRITELAAETEAMQLILCRALVAPSGEVPELANSLWYANLTPEIRPRESLLSQGTYHVKEISRNGNMAYVLVCHPTLGSRYVDLSWRDAGYRAEAVGTLRDNGCQENFERRGYIADYEPEETIRFSFGERVFSAGDMSAFPRS